MHASRTFISFVFTALAALTLSSGCAQTTHEVRAAGPLVAQSKTPLKWSEFEARLSEPGPVRLRKIVAADWAVPLGGMLNLDHPRAKEAELKDGPEAIQIYMYELEHAEHGAFLVDTGIARSVAQQTEEMPLRWPVTSAMPFEELKVRLDTKAYLEARETSLQGVFLTHLHLDHLLGLQDIPKEVPLYIGPAEHRDKRFSHLLVRPTTNLNLEGFSALNEWQISASDDEHLAFVDIFGDASVVGLHVPGHTRGSMAFVVCSTQGPQLIVGDASHTAWGWEHDVEPGSYNSNGEQAAHSLKLLRAFAARHPQMRLHLGHQRLGHEHLGR